MSRRVGNLPAGGFGRFGHLTSGDLTLWASVQLASGITGIVESVIDVNTPPQQNLWGDSGSGSRPKL